MKRWSVPGALAITACSAPTPVMDAGTGDAGHLDAGTRDAGAMDAGAIDAGYDAGPGDIGPCPNAAPYHPTFATSTDDAGRRCLCQQDMPTPLPDGGFPFTECCDSYVPNPCPVCCGFLTDADGGPYFDDAGMPQCFC